jgi:hypothetical protein
MDELDVGPWAALMQRHPCSKCAMSATRNRTRPLKSAAFASPRAIISAETSVPTTSPAG